MMDWLRKNLFRSVLDSIVSVVGGALAVYLLYRILRFVFVTGRWTIVRDNLSLYMTGSWPTDQLWRLTVSLVALSAMGGFVAGFVARRQADSPTPPEVRSTGERIVDLGSRLWPAVVTVVLLLLLATTIGPWLLVLAMLAAAVVGRLVGARIPMRSSPLFVMVTLFFVLAVVWFLNAGVGWDDWGGVLLNFFLAAISIALCFPFGVLLALGRRSEFPIIRALSTIYIELFRGVPLIALLLMANVALGFFIPQSITPGIVVRAIVVFVLFTSAYVAEIVRGGLQSVPRGQIEAARANGLSPIPVMTRIVLPQAMRNVIPAMVGQFISLFKDTTLAGAVMRFNDLLSAAEASTSQTEFQGQGLIAETLVFVLLLFWAGSYTMSRESQRLEKRLGVGQR